MLAHIPLLARYYDEALASARHPDVVFLDMQMPAVDGFGVIKLRTATVCVH